MKTFKSVTGIESGTMKDFKFQDISSNLGNDPVLSLEMAPQPPP